MYMIKKEKENENKIENENEYKAKYKNKDQKIDKNISIEEKKYKKVLRIKQLSMIVIILISVFITIKFYPFLYNLKYEVNRDAFEESIKNMGGIGIIILTFLQVTQIVLAFLPGQPIEIVAGMAYGMVIGTCICTLGIFIGTAIVYYLVKILGKSFVMLFVKPETLEKIEKMPLFNDEKKLKAFLFFVFFVPIFPKDIFVYIGGLTKLSDKDFLTIATLSRIPGQMLGVYVGVSIVSKSYIMPIIVTFIVGILSVIAYILVKRRKIKSVDLNDIKNIEGK